jgi:transposase InsO family protein
LAHAQIRPRLPEPAINGNACRDGIGDYLHYYNSERPHSSLDDQTPDEVYYQSRINQRAA